jgi:predicted lipid carrier protein YhbT
VAYRARGRALASVDECRQALHDLAARLDSNADKVRDRVDLDRTLACRVTDLETAFHGRLTDGRLVDLADGDDPKAKIALTTTSDDLVALVNGHLDVPKALAAGRVSIKANPLDLLKLRKLL